MFLSQRQGATFVLCKSRTIFFNKIESKFIQTNNQIIDTRIVFYALYFMSHFNMTLNN